MIISTILTQNTVVMNTIQIIFAHMGMLRKKLKKNKKLRLLFFYINTIRYDPFMVFKTI